jgi:hypothetical protein
VKPPVPGGGFTIIPIPPTKPPDLNIVVPPPAVPPAGFPADVDSLCQFFINALPTTSPTGLSLQTLVKQVLLTGTKDQILRVADIILAQGFLEVSQCLHRIADGRPGAPIFPTDKP